jgi:glutamyl-tRNA synthetase
VKAALEGALIDRLGLKPRVAFGPVRVATSGRRVSPPLFESLAILGADETLARIRRLRSAVA